MSTATVGATIFYTSDGSAPTHNGGSATGTTTSGPSGTSGASYSVPTCETDTINAVASKQGMSDSNDTSTTATNYDSSRCGAFAPMTASSSSQTIVYSVWDGDWAIHEGNQ